MVTDSSMLLSVGLSEAQASVTPRAEQPVPGTGGRSDVLADNSASRLVDAESSVVKNIVEERSAETGSLHQQNLDSFALTNNQSPKAVDPFSTAGTVFQRKG